MSRGWRSSIDPAVASLIEAYAPELLEGDPELGAELVRSTQAILREGRDAELGEELLEQKLVDYLLGQEEKRCRP